MAALIEDGNVLGLLEHHTHALGPEALQEHLIRFAEGELGDEEVFQGGGHGMFYLNRPPGLSRLTLIAVTGPHRAKARKTRLPCHYPAPHGDMMMTGPAGLVMAAAQRLS